MNLIVQHDGSLSQVRELDTELIKSALIKGDIRVVRSGYGEIFEELSLDGDGEQRWDPIPSDD